LNSDNFEDLCNRILIDLGYRSTQAPSAGKDGGIDLINQKGTIIGHCTVMKGSSNFIQKKLLSDIEKSINKLKSLKKVFLFSRNRVFNDQTKRNHFFQNLKNDFPSDIEFVLLDSENIIHEIFNIYLINNLSLSYRYIFAKAREIHKYLVEGLNYLDGNKSKHEKKLEEVKEIIVNMRYENVQIQSNLISSLLNYTPQNITEFHELNNLLKKTHDENIVEFILTSMKSKILIPITEIEIIKLSSFIKSLRSEEVNKSIIYSIVQIFKNEFYTSFIDKSKPVIESFVVALLNLESVIIDEAVLNLSGAIKNSRKIFTLTKANELILNKAETLKSQSEFEKELEKFKKSPKRRKLEDFIGLSKKAKTFREFKTIFYFFLSHNRRKTTTHWSDIQEQEQISELIKQFPRKVQRNIFFTVNLLVTAPYIPRQRLRKTFCNYDCEKDRKGNKEVHTSRKACHHKGGRA